VREQINAKFFAASINEILRRMLEKLGRNPKFSNIHRIVTEKIRALVEERKPLYDKFSITPSLEKIVRER
jgi:shikimate kinase